MQEPSSILQGSPRSDSAYSTSMGHHLPLEVVTHVLQHMDQRQRLACALVSRSWHTAALANTTSLVVNFQKRSQGSLYKWLTKHGDRLTSIQIINHPHQYCNNGKDPVLTVCLPLPKLTALQQLWLHNLNLGPEDIMAQAGETAADSARPIAANKLHSHSAINSLAALTALTMLHMGGASISDSLGGFRALGALTTLRELSLHGAFVLGLDEALKHLTQLKSLRWQYGSNVCWALGKSLSSLQQLQELRVQHCCDTYATTFALLPASVTLLQVAGSAEGRWDFNRCKNLKVLHLSGARLSGGQMPGLLQLTALTELHLPGSEVDDHVDTQVLAKLTNLRSLTIKCTEDLTDKGMSILRQIGLKCLNVTGPRSLQLNT